MICPEGLEIITIKSKLLKTNSLLNPGYGAEWWNLPLINAFNDDIGWAGLSNIVAYEAYGDETFLERAKGAYDFILEHGYISQQVIQDGYLIGTKNPSNTVQASCNGGSMLGGVYWVNGNNPPGATHDPANSDAINAVSTGNFALLGTELCRLTKEMSYCDRSYQNVWWLDRHMMSAEGRLYDHISGKRCTLTDWRFTYNQGLYLATYASLGKLTNNATAISKANDAIAKAIESTAPWNNDNGIIKEGSGDAMKTDDGIGFKSIMIRYLHKAALLIDQPDLTDAIREYVNIQYYGLSQLASDDPDHPVQYGRNWLGPYVPSTTQAHMAAMDVLNALTLNPDSAYPSSGSGHVMTTGDRTESASRADSSPSPINSHVTLSGSSGPTAIGAIMMLQASTSFANDARTITTAGSGRQAPIPSCTGRSRWRCMRENRWQNTSEGN